MKKLPVGIQDFRKIIEGGYIYADKTEYIYNLINNASFYFLSRPRRFGKSLLLDTIAEVFRGERELFKGLWIYDSEYVFEKHPVIKLDMSSIANDSPDILRESVMSNLNKQISDEGLSINENNPGDLFCRFIEGLHKKHGARITVLIDEYDKPILDHLTDIKTAEANRQVLRGFYGILKSMDSLLRFTFITGVTKFTKTSIFSGLNNLSDLTMDREYAGICGIPCDSLKELFGEHIDHLSAMDRFSRYDSVYVMEFKYAKCDADAGEDVKQKLFDKTLDEGMTQIDERGYCNKYTGGHKTVHKVAFAFLGRSEIEIRHIAICPE